MLVPVCSHTLVLSKPDLLSCFTRLTLLTTALLDDDLAGLALGVSATRIISVHPPSLRLLLFGGAPTAAHERVEAIPSIAHGVVGSARQLLGDVAPTATIRHHLAHNQLILLPAPVLSIRRGCASSKASGGERAGRKLAHLLRKQWLSRLEVELDRGALVPLFRRAAPDCERRWASHRAVVAEVAAGGARPPFALVPLAPGPIWRRGEHRWLCEHLVLAGGDQRPCRSLCHPALLHYALVLVQEALPLLPVASTRTGAGVKLVPTGPAPAPGRPSSLRPAACCVSRPRRQAAELRPKPAVRARAAA